MKLTIYIRSIGFIVLLMFSYLTVFAQNNANKGDRYFDKNLFQEAIKYYKIEAKTGERRFANYAKQQLAACYRILGEFEMAEDMYRKLLKSKRNRDNPIFYLNYGKSLKSSAKYSEAKIQFNQYIKLKPSDPMGPIFLYSCDSAQKWLEETIGKEVKNVEKINTAASDFAPVLFASNQLVFSSSREGTKEAFVSFDGGMKVNRLDLYQANIATLAGKEAVDCSGFSVLNSPLHEGSATFSIDGKEVYFTRTIKGKKVKSENKRKKNEKLSTLQVFYSQIDSTGNWTEPINAFSFNSTKYSIGQPSLSKDGERIFFISDMKGGYGATDIYYSEKREDGTWIEPINAGGDVNTFGYELFPYISENDVLYFSSDSHIGMGKLDIFSSTLKKDNWGNVQNLKPPFNSIGNDFGIVFDQDYSRGFFSSDRFNGKGSEDIYSFSENVPIEIIFNGNKLEFADNAIYDGLKYTLKNLVTQKDTTLTSSNGMFSFPLESNQDYVLVAKKNRFSINNKIEIKVQYNDDESYFQAVLKPKLQPIHIKGYLSLPDVNDTTNTRRLPVQGKYIKISDSTDVEQVKSASNGYYQFKTEFKSGVEYTFVASKKEIPKEIIAPKKKVLLRNSVLIKGIVKDKSGNFLEGKVIVKKEGEVIQEIKVDTNGNFKFKGLTGIEYEIIVIAEGYFPRLKSIVFDSETNVKVITKIFILSSVNE